MNYEQLKYDVQVLTNRRKTLLRMRSNEADIEKHNKEVDDMICKLGSVTHKYGERLDNLKHQAWSALVSKLGDGRYGVVTGKYAPYTYKR